MLRFESWPPEPGRVELLDETVEMVESTQNLALQLGRATALLLLEAGDIDTTKAIIKELKSNLSKKKFPEDHGFWTGEETLSPRQAFGEGASSEIHLAKKRVA